MSQLKNNSNLDLSREWEILLIYYMIFQIKTAKFEKISKCWLETREISWAKFEIAPGSGVAEGDDLSGADEGEVERVEEENDVFTTVVLQADFLELTWKK